MSGEGSSSSGKPSSSQAQSQGETGQKKDGAEEPREGEGEGQDQKEPSDQPSENGEPKSSQPDQPGGIKDHGDQAAEGEREAAQRAGSDVEIWGNLPIHLRDIFRAEGQGDMPARYRDWIDSYYRRLNEHDNH
jgi:hypothetical protein